LTIAIQFLSYLTTIPSYIKYILNPYSQHGLLLNASSLF